MKLSFSIKGWERYAWADYVRIAKEMELQGIELRNIHATPLTARGGPFHAHMASATLRELYEAGLSLPCIDAVCDIADGQKLEENCREIADCIETARQFKIPNIRVHATSGGEVTDALMECLRRSETLAMQAGVTVLIETVGIFADTGRLRDVLNSFASDYLAVLWDFQHPYRVCGETADQTIQNLGAYVRHVHVRDSVVVDSAVEPRLVGEGDLPIPAMLNALRSVNYDGFLSLEWDPAWMPEIDDLEVILPHYVNYMTGLHDPYKTRATLYDNAAHTGKFPWKKELIIDQTFPQVLDRMVEEFPDQYAFKFTTLDYTRTYSQFRDDVDQFARALIALGVKKGDKVAIWATNVPAWFITFWATTKIGAILVTMNTAYKIHEAEYLLRQSDTHTLVMIDGYRDSNYAGIIAELCPELETTPSGKSLHAKQLPFLRSKSHKVGYVVFYDKDLDVKNGKVPLVLVFHGGGDSAYATASLAEWPEIGQKEGFITVAVEMHLHVAAGEVPALIDHLLEEYSIDPEKIYATGFSMGGIKSWDLYEQCPERFAALMPMDAIDYVGHNCFGGLTETVNENVLVPLFYIGGVDSFGVELPCHHERAVERIAYVSKVNRFRSGYGVSFAEKDRWEDPLYGVRGDRVEVLHDDMFPDSVYTVHFFDSDDGRCYTALMGVTHHAHEIRTFTNRYAWDFVKHFRRTKDGIVIE